MAPLLRIVLALAVLLGLVPGAQAQFNFVPELRVGVTARDVDNGASLFDPTRISDANAELLFNAPDLNAWTVVGELRPHLGATVSLSGKDSYAYAGLSWTFQAPVLPIFAEVSIGGVARSALIAAPQNDPSRNFGCGLGARATASVGVNLPAGTSLIATLEHLPDFGTCGVANRPATNLGVRLGFRF